MGSGAVGVEFASIFNSVRQRRDDRRAAAAARAGRRRGGFGRAGEVVPQAGHHEPYRREGHEREDRAGRNRRRRRRAARRRHDAEDSRADYLLVATGRGPVTTGLDAEGVGLQMEKGYIKVDALYRTNVPGISAIGDVITMARRAHPQLAHVSSAEGIVAAERIAGHDTRPINYDHVPGLHVLRSRNRQRGPHGAQGAGARLRRARRHVSVRRARPREDGGRDRRVREDRRRQEIRRDARRPHDRPAVDRARRGGDGSPCSSSQPSKS